MNRWAAEPDGSVGPAAGAGQRDVLNAGLTQPVERGLHVEVGRVARPDHDDHLAVGLMVAGGARHRPDGRPAGAGRHEDDAALPLAEEGTAEGPANAHAMAESDAASEFRGDSPVRAGANVENQFVQLAGAVDPEGRAVVAARIAGERD